MVMVVVGDAKNYEIRNCFSGMEIKFIKYEIIPNSILVIKKQKSNKNLNKGLKLFWTHFITGTCFCVIPIIAYKLIIFRR